MLHLMKLFFFNLGQLKNETVLPILFHMKYLQAKTLFCTKNYDKCVPNHGFNPQ